MHRQSVSIVIPNLNGRQCLEHCLPAVEALDYPRELIECLVVDNGSIDGSTYYLRKNFPQVKIIQIKKNSGFAAAINQGANAAGGEILFLLNNDARPLPDCLAYLVDPIRSGETVCTAAKIISAKDQTIHFARGGMNFHGVGFQHGEGDIDGDRYNKSGPCLFACGGAMAIRRDVFLEVGGMDEDFFAYFEDVDLGWRLWGMGFDIKYVPNATVTHWQSATSRFIDLGKIRVLQIRNPLVMIYKNYQNEFLQRIFPVAWMLTIRRTWYLSRINAESLRIGDEPHLADYNPQRLDPPVPVISDKEVRIPEISLSDFVALNDWLTNFPNLDHKRKQIQQRRTRPDSEIVQMFLDPFRYCEDKIEYRRLQDQLCDAFGINGLFHP